MREDEAPGASAAKRGCAAALQVACWSRWAICAARSGCTASLAGVEKDRASEESIITEAHGVAAFAGGYWSEPEPSYVNLND